MVVDCIPFFKDLDLLEIRLHSLAPHVDEFVVLESPMTLAYKPKPLYYEENKNRFKDFNIRHIVYEPSKDFSPWDRAWDQIRFMISRLDVPDDCMILISDGDEIPNLSAWDGREGVFKMERYYYRLNGYSGKRDWLGTDAILKSTLKNIDIKEIRWHRQSNAHLWAKNVYRRGGWHFCCLGSIEDVLHKYEANAHQELNRPKKFAQIRENYENRVHPLHLVPSNHNWPRKLVTQMPSGPEWLLQNKDQYRHLFYDECSPSND